MLIWREENKPIGVTRIWTGIIVATTQSPDHYTITTGHHRMYADVKKETFHFFVSNRLIVIRLCKFITFETVSEHKWPTRKKSASGVTKVFAEQRKKGTNDLMGKLWLKGHSEVPSSVFWARPHVCCGLKISAFHFRDALTPSPQETSVIHKLNCQILRKPEHRQVPQAKSSKCSSDPFWD